MPMAIASITPMSRPMPCASRRARRWSRPAAPSARSARGITRVHAPAALRLPALALSILAAAAAHAQTAVKYRDADGHWIFTDQSGNAARAAPGEPLAVGHE